MGIGFILIKLDVVKFINLGSFLWFCLWMLFFLELCGNDFCLKLLDFWYFRSECIFNWRVSYILGFIRLGFGFVGGWNSFWESNSFNCSVLRG